MPNNKTRHAVLTIKITYDDVKSNREIKDVLAGAAEHLANNGLLSEGTDLVVDDWDFTVEVKK